MAPAEEMGMGMPMTIGEVVQERERDLRCLQEENLELKMIIYLLKSDLETRHIAHEADMNVLRTRLSSETTTNKSLRWQTVELKCAAADKEKHYRQKMVHAIVANMDAINHVENEMREAHRTSDRMLQKIIARTGDKINNDNEYVV